MFFRERHYESKFVDVDCLIELGSQHLDRPHGLNNQILLLTTIVQDLSHWIPDSTEVGSHVSNRCKIYVPEWKVYLDKDQTASGEPFEERVEVGAIFDLSQSGVLASAEEFVELQKRENHRIFDVSYDELVSDGPDGPKASDWWGEPITLRVDTGALWEGSMWRWFAQLFFFRRASMRDFLMHELKWSQDIIKLFDEIQEKEVPTLEEDVLAVHVRLAPHCESTARRFSFGRWYEAVYSCHPTFEQFRKNIDEVLMVSKTSLSKLLVMSSNMDSEVVQAIVEFYRDVRGMDVFEENEVMSSLQGQHPRFVLDIVSMLFLEKAAAHLSPFVSTFSLVGAAKRDFVGSWFVRSFGKTFGRLGGTRCFRFFLVLFSLCAFWVFAHRLPPLTMADMWANFLLLPIFLPALVEWGLAVVFGFWNIDYLRIIERIRTGNVPPVVG